MSLNFFFPEKSPAADVDNAESPRGEREDKLGFEGEKREGKESRKGERRRNKEREEN